MISSSALLFLMLALPFTDSECDDGLACFQRSGNEAIPGCVGGSYGSDYCYRLPTDASAQNPSPSEKTLALIQNSGISRYSLGECEGGKDLRTTEPEW